MRMIFSNTFDCTGRIEKGSKVLCNRRVLHLWDRADTRNFPLVREDTGFNRVVDNMSEGRYDVVADRFEVFDRNSIVAT